MMQTDNRLFDDLARMANGALHTLSGVRDEVESRMRERLERWLADMDMVPREEFEAVKAMARTARAEQEALSQQVAALQRQLDELRPGKAARTSTKPGPKTAKAAAGSAAKSGPKPAAKKKAAAPRRSAARAAEAAPAAKGGEAATDKPQSDPGV